MRTKLFSKNCLSKCVIFYKFVFYIISDLYNHLSTMFLFFIISVYLSSVYIVSFYKFVFDILSRHPAGCGAKFLLDIKVKVSNLQLFRVHTNVMAPHYPHTQCHEETIHDTALTTKSHHTERGLLKYPATKRRIRERDLHVCAPRLP